VVRSLVVQEQLLLAAPGGRLVLLVTQRMPDLPAGEAASIGNSLMHAGRSAKGVTDAWDCNAMKPQQILELA
jgi:hypothetical protein